MERPRYIVVEGPIGVGKTSLVNALSARYNARTVFEVVEENPFLAAFYTDRDKYAFQTQLFFLLSRYKQQQDLFQQELFQQVTVSDYLLEKDRIFARMTLTNHELALYERIYDTLGTRVVKPDLVIYLQARLDVLLARIKKRGREFERRFDADYLDQLCQAYTRYFNHYTDTPLLVINTSHIDYVGNPLDLENIFKAVEGMKGGRLELAPQGAASGGKTA
jgi:deoxyadenosine/deoxycytidine kinase